MIFGRSAPLHLFKTYKDLDYSKYLRAFYIYRRDSCLSILKILITFHGWLSLGNISTFALRFLKFNPHPELPSKFLINSSSFFFSLFLLNCIFTSFCFCYVSVELIFLFLLFNNFSFSITIHFFSFLFYF